VLSVGGFVCGFGVVFGGMVVFLGGSLVYRFLVGGCWEEFGLGWGVFLICVGDLVGVVGEKSV